MSIAANNPKIFGALFSRAPSGTQRKIYCWAWIAIYILLFIFKDSLPEKFSRDATLLAEMVETNTFDTGSFGAMASLYAALPSWLVPLLPIMLGVPSLWIVLKNIRSYAVMLLIPLILMPYLIMNFMYPSKETLVALIALVVYGLTQSSLSTVKVVLLIAAIYVAYAASIRDYYFIILGFFVMIVVSRRIPLPLTVLGVIVGLTVLVFVPSDVFMQLQGPRDEAAWKMQTIGKIVRTYFYNLLPPDNAVSFLVNTAWGVFVMFFPFVIAHSFNEALMMINVFFYAGLVMAIVRHKRDAAQLPAFLFMGHILTQAQFEPDLGSYLRHFSSVLVMLAPGIPYIFPHGRPAEKQLAGNVPPPQS